MLTNASLQSDLALVREGLDRPRLKDYHSYVEALDRLAQALEAMEANMAPGAAWAAAELIRGHGDEEMAAYLLRNFPTGEDYTGCYESDLAILRAHFPDAPIPRGVE